MANVYAVIMAGGAGTRFWPASRNKRPKQLLPLGGDDKALLTATVDRLAPIVPASRVFIVTGAHLADATLAAVPEVPKAQVLCEPAARNTAPCIAWANATIASLDPEAVVMVLPSDHFITNVPEFQNVLRAAVASAEAGHVTTVGIVPTRPETGYGYIEVGDALTGRGEPTGARKVASFVEKPNREKAEKLVAAGPQKYLWNAGMFFFRVKDMAALLEQHVPAIAAGVSKMGTDAAKIQAIFPTLDSVSIDVGVMEKAGNLAVVPGDFGWNDVGSWQSAWELAPKDAAGNAVGGENNLALDAKNNLIRGTGKKAIALVGVNDLVVVETDDAILVIPRERAQDVRLVVDALKAAKKTELV